VVEGTTKVESICKHQCTEFAENWRKVHNGYLQKAVSCVKYKEPTSYTETTQYTKTIMKGTSMIYRTLHNKQLRDFGISCRFFFYDGTEHVMPTH
jgi:hypothetical protein